MKQKFDVTGMSCAACSAAVERAVNKLDGVDAAQVNLLANSMQVEYDEAAVTEADICAAVEKAGYGASPAAPAGRPAPAKAAPAGEDPAEAELRSMKKRLAVSLAFLIPLMYVSMGHMMGLPLPAFFHGREGAVTFALTQFLLVLPILYVNRKFYAVGFKSLWHRSPNMDSLIALGSAAAVVYGLFALYRIGWGLGTGDMELVDRYRMDLYFESAGTILTLITLGKFLEARAKGRTGAAIRALMDLAPDTALVLRSGVETEIPAEEVAVANGKATIKRRLEHGVETVECPLPLVVTVNGSATPCRPRNARLVQKYKYAVTPSEKAQLSEEMAKLVDARPYLNLYEWSAAEVNADPTQIGLAGSPTKVKGIVNVVFQAKESKTLEGKDDAAIEELIKDLIANHTIG